MKVTVTREGTSKVSLQPVAIEVVSVVEGQVIEAGSARELHLCKTLISLGWAVESKGKTSAKVEEVVESKMDETVNENEADEVPAEAPKKRTRKKKADKE